MKFSIAKYLDYRRTHDGQPQTVIDALKAFDSMLECEGWEKEKVEEKKGLCMEEWCDE